MDNLAVQTKELRSRVDAICSQEAKAGDTWQEFGAAVTRLSASRQGLEVPPESLQQVALLANQEAVVLRSWTSVLKCSVDDYCNYLDAVHSALDSREAHRRIVQSTHEAVESTRLSGTAADVAQGSQGLVQAEQRFQQVHARVMADSNTFKATSNAALSSIFMQFARLTLATNRAKFAAADSASQKLRVGSSDGVFCI
jgi:hypothetical protein